MALPPFAIVLISVRGELKWIFGLCSGGQVQRQLSSASRRLKAPGLSM